jgi:hypothetical protein
MKVRNLNIAIFGSSVALTIRPFRSSREEGNYSDVIKSELDNAGFKVLMKNFASRSRLIVHEDVLEYVGNLQKANPDFTVLHYGINEAAPRVWPYRIWLSLHKPKWYRSRFHERFYPFLLRIETLIIKSLKMKGWVSKRKFHNMLKLMVETTVRETLSKVILISIGKPNDNYIRILPGVEQLITDFNIIINDVAKETGSYLVDINKLGEEADLNLCPDGAHLSFPGHLLVGKEICKYIQRQYENTDL